MDPIRPTAGQSAGKREERRPEPFAGKGPMAESIVDVDLQRCLHNEFDMGCAQPAQGRPLLGFSEQNYDHHLF